MPLAPKVSVERAKAVTRAMARVWGSLHRPMSPTQRTMARRTHEYTPPPRDDDATEMDPDMSGFADYGDSSDWPCVSDAVSAAGFLGDDSSATWLPTRAANVRATGRCEVLPPRSGVWNAGINPYDANPGRRFQFTCPPPANYPGQGQRKRRLQESPSANSRRRRRREVFLLSNHRQT